MTTLYLIRHCESVGNAQGRMQGRSNHDITEDGEKQLAALEKRMADIELTAIYSSPLIRAHKTAKAINGVRNFEINLCDDLQEISFGSWEDMLWTDIKKMYPEQIENWYNDPYSVRFEGGESFDDLEKRVVVALKEIAAKHKGGTIAVATHGAPIRLFARYATDSDRKLTEYDWARNTSVSTYEIDDDGNITLIEYGNADHLVEDLSKEVFKK